MTITTSNSTRVNPESESMGFFFIKIGGGFIVSALA